MGKLVLYGIGGIVAVVVGFRLIAALLVMVLAATGFILFKVVPLILIGWLVMKAWRIWKERPVT